MRLTPFKKHKEQSPRPLAFEIFWTRRRMWIAITWSVIVASAAVAHYFFIFLPEEQKQSLELRRQEQALEERLEKAKMEQEKTYRDAATEAKQFEDLRLDSCLTAAENTYVASWDRECADRGSARDCRLPNDVSDDFNAQFREAKEECFRRFKQI